MSNIVLDDTDASLTYSGQWNLFAGGSSRQWDSTVHSTFQSGATVSFQFQGSVCKVYGTVPPGNGSTILIDVTIDGSVSPIVSRTSGSAADYANLFYQSSAMESVWHTVIITNRGGAGNLNFEFDRVELDANDIVPTFAPFSPSSTAAAASPSTSSTLLNISLNPTGTITTTSIAHTLSGASSSSQPSKALAQATTVTSTSPSVLTQIVTTTRQDGSVVTSTSEVTLFPTAASQASALMVPVGTVIGIVGGIVALLILLLLLFLCHRRRKAKNHRFALMGLGSDNVAQNMSQNLTTVATPFTLAPLPSSSTDLNATLDSSRLPLFSTMSEKALRQQTYPNRAETDLEPASTSPDLAPSSNAPAFSVSVPSTHATASNSLNQPSLDLSPLSEPSDSSGPQGPPEPNQAANNDAAYRLRYLSGSTSIAGPVTSAYGGISDVPPAYRPNE